MTNTVRIVSAALLGASMVVMASCASRSASPDPAAAPAASASQQSSMDGYSSDAARAPVHGGVLRDGFESVVDDFVVSVIVDLSPGKVVLVDAGFAADAGPIMAALKKRGLGADAVQAILLTHGDWDHTNGVLQFPKAEVMALETDVDLVEGRVAKVPSRPAKLSGIKVNRALRDGDVVELGGVRFEVFAVPGHTPGSAAYLAKGVLFVGDSAGTSTEDKLLAGDPQHTVDQPRNRASLRELAARLKSREAEIEVIVPSHTRALHRGLAPLLEFAAARKD